MISVLLNSCPGRHGPQTRGQTQCQRPETRQGPSVRQRLPPSLGTRERDANLLALETTLTDSVRRLAELLPVLESNSLPLLSLSAWQVRWRSYIRRCRHMAMARSRLALRDARVMSEARLTCRQWSSCVTLGLCGCPHSQQQTVSGPCNLLVCRRNPAGPVQGWQGRSP